MRIPPAEFTCVGCGFEVVTYAGSDKAVELKLCHICWYLMCAADDTREGLSKSLKHDCDLAVLGQMHKEHIKS